MVLIDIKRILDVHETSDFSVFDIGKIGSLLKNYYELHSNQEYERSLRYSMGFEGFLDNLRGLKLHVSKKDVFSVGINDENACNFKGQYYPLQIEDDKCVKNNCDLSKKIIITGPNASGKTTLLKTTTINIICSQQIGMGFFAEGSTINPYTHIHSYLNIPDTSQRDSLFQAESRRCKDILDIIQSASKTSRHFGIFDELYSGTNPDEATKSGYAFLKYLSKYSNVDFILTTHYNKICLKLNKNENIQNYKMNVIEGDDGNLEYTYKMKRGISKVQGAIKILEDMKYPQEIIDEVKNFNKKPKDSSTEIVDEKKIQKHD
jgi:DNA mismatch repair ATPase MutS